MFTSNENQRGVRILVLMVGCLTFGALAQAVELVPLGSWQSGDNFGESVSICGDYALVGATHHDTSNMGGKTDAGAAFVFKRLGADSWGVCLMLRASDGDPGDYFGCAVSLTDNYAVVGASGDDAAGVGTGAAYIFEEPPGGWESLTYMTETVKLPHPDAQSSVAGNPGSYFGSSVCIDDGWAIVGAPHHDTVNGTIVNAGQAYVFSRQSAGNWPEHAKLTANDGAASDFFGRSVSIWCTGTYFNALVGAPCDDDNGSASGSAYVFGWS
jgi:hypothetical protein